MSKNKEDLCMFLAATMAIVNPEFLSYVTCGGVALYFVVRCLEETGRVSPEE